MSNKIIDKRVEMAVKFLKLSSVEVCNAMTVPQAMHYAGFDAAECQDSKIQMRVRRARQNEAKSQMVIDVVQSVSILPEISPLSEVEFLSINSEKSKATASSTSVLRGPSSKIAPGMKQVRQTPYQVFSLSKNKFVISKLHDSAVKEATIAWRDELEKKMRGEPHKTAIEVVSIINNKIEYKNIIKPLCDRTVRHYVQNGIIGVTPPRRGCPGLIPLAAYNALLEAVKSYISIKQASGAHEITKREMSIQVNDVINSHPDENRKNAKLLNRLQKDFGVEFNFGKTLKVEDRRVKWTTHQNLKMWGDQTKNVIIELGFGRESTAEDNVSGEIFFFEGQMERIVNFDETRITTDQTDVQRGGRPSFVFYNPNLPRPGSATNKSSLSLTMIVGGTAAGEMIPPHFQLCTSSQNDETDTWNTRLISKMHDVYGKFGYPEPKYHPCTY